MTDECSICHCRTCELTSVRGQLYCDECVGLAGGGFAETCTGRLVSFEAPDPSTICIEDIAVALSRQIRWNGHGSKFYTVGDHSLACMAYAYQDGGSRLLQLGALLHDAAEAYTGDIVKPLKLLLGEQIVCIEAALNRAIWQALCEGLPEEYGNEAVKRIDGLMLSTEAFDFMPSKGASLGPNNPPPDASITIEPGEPHLVAELYQASYRALYEQALEEQA